MRSEREIFDLILNVANSDERIRAVILNGSRTYPSAPKDCYQDYDIVYFVTDIAPFFNNPTWAEEKFGKPLMLQMPEAMRYPDGDGSFGYLMLFPDGVRIDLGVEFKPYIDDGEPAIVLLDKDEGEGFVPLLPPPNDRIWHVKRPSELFYLSCCNNFWWCLNNVAKGIARDELPYVMWMYNEVVRGELEDMLNWLIGTEHEFSVSCGKHGKYYKNLLTPERYEQYKKTYSGADYNELWAAVDAACDLFHEAALEVGQYMNYTYNQKD